MVEFVNKATNTRMWVAENRVEEYKAAGHIPAADISKAVPHEEVEKPKRIKKERK